MTIGHFVNKNKTIGMQFKIFRGIYYWNVEFLG